MTSLKLRASVRPAAVVTVHFTQYVTPSTPPDGQIDAVVAALA
jgi:hypothetical protein